MKNIS